MQQLNVYQKLQYAYQVKPAISNTIYTDPVSEIPIFITEEHMQSRRLGCARVSNIGFLVSIEADIKYLSNCVDSHLNANPVPAPAPVPVLIQIHHVHLHLRIQTIALAQLGHETVVVRFIALIS